MEERTHKQALPTGYRLQNFRVLRVLGVGGFGVTYLAEHITLGQRAAIKEYLPNEFAVREGATVHPKSEADREDFEWGLQRFLDEARTLARFEHRNVVRVRDYFEANRTAYIVMDYEEGEPLDRLLERHGRLTEVQLKRVLLPIIDGLREVHGAGFLHRDIKPSNVFVRRSDETPVLLDFGAARQALGRKSKSLTAVASAGYSPPEQYESEGAQGPWTDIYALSALCYRAITGKAPVEATRRQSSLLRSRSDALPRLAEAPPGGYSQPFLEAVDWGLRVIETERPQSLDEWVAALSDGFVGRPVSAAPSTGQGIRAKPGTGRPEGQTRGRSLAAVWVAAAAALAAVAVAAVWWLYFAKEPPPPVDLVSQAIEAAPFVIEPDPPSETPELSPLEGGTAILVVETEPEGVEVLVGDALAGETPLQLMTVRPGTYPVTLRHPDYETGRLDDQVFADGRVLRIERTMVRATGELTVIAEPANVWIERDGERLAEGTPVTLEGLAAGTLELTLGADEYRSLRVEVDVPKDGVGILRRTLERIPYGTLTLELEPPDATVTLPDVAPAYRPGVRLPEGQHRVIVARKGFRQTTRTLEVAGDTRERIELMVDPQSFTVVTTPADAVVRLMNVEDDYRDGILLNPGEYRIQISAPEYETLEERVSHGIEPTLYSVALARRPQPFTIVATPGEATVSFAGRSEVYAAGMRLPPGEYRIRVSAEGYETREERVRHGTDPTRLEVSLDRSAPQPGETFVDAIASGGNGPEMVVIPAGNFRMGCLSYDDDCYDDEKPVHDVRIPQPFALSKFEVTRGDFSRFVEATGYSTGNSCRTYEGGSWEVRSGRSWRSPAFQQTDAHPVVCVNWQDAKAYIAWLSRETGEVYRLASESEWEYAARAGSVTKYAFGNDESRLCRHGNHADASTSFSNRHTGCSDGVGERTAVVGSYEINAFGLHDMHGNVWEWVEDCWNDSYYGAPTQGEAWTSGDCAQRVLRGGSWVSKTEDPPLREPRQVLHHHPEQQLRVPRCPDAHPLKPYLLTSGGFQGGGAPLVAKFRHCGLKMRRGTAF